MYQYNYVFFNTEDSKLNISDQGYYAICAEDLKRSECVHLVNYPLDYASKWVRGLFILHHMHRINRIVKLPLKSLWFPYYFNHRFPDNKPICFVLSGQYISPEYLRYLKKEYKNCRVVKIYRDKVSSWEKNCPAFTKEAQRELIDLHMSYDEGECDKYGMSHFVEFESKTEVPVSTSYPLSDIFFAGRPKGRLERLFAAYHKFSDAGLKCSYYLVGVPKEQQIPLEGITYADKLMTYREMLYHTVNTRCVLEFNPKGAVGYTSRFLEAVIYGKKLITDNMSIRNSEFYNPAYISCVSTVEEMDPTFVKVDVGEINYHYNGEFSPIHLIENIDRQLVRLDEETTC